MCDVWYGVMWYAVWCDVCHCVMWCVGLRYLQPVDITYTYVCVCDMCVKSCDVWCVVYVICVVYMMYAMMRDVLGLVLWPHITSNHMTHHTWHITHLPHGSRTLGPTCVWCVVWCVVCVHFTHHLKSYKCNTTYTATTQPLTANCMMWWCMHVWCDVCITHITFSFGFDHFQFFVCVKPYRYVMRCNVMCDVIWCVWCMIFDGCCVMCMCLMCMCVCECEWECMWVRVMCVMNVDVRDACACVLLVVACHIPHAPVCDVWLDVRCHFMCGVRCLQHHAWQKQPGGNILLLCVMCVCNLCVRCMCDVMCDMILYTHVHSMSAFYYTNHTTNHTSHTTHITFIHWHSHKLMWVCIVHMRTCVQCDGKCTYVMWYDVICYVMWCMMCCIYVCKSNLSHLIKSNYTPHRTTHQTPHITHIINHISLHITPCKNRLFPARWITRNTCVIYDVWCNVWVMCDVCCVFTMRNTADRCWLFFPSFISPVRCVECVRVVYVCVHVWYMMCDVCLLCDVMCVWYVPWCVYDMCVMVTLA